MGLLTDLVVSDWLRVCDTVGGLLISVETDLVDYCESLDGSGVAAERGGHTQVSPTTKKQTLTGWSWPLHIQVCPRVGSIQIYVSYLSFPIPTRSKPREKTLCPSSSRPCCPIVVRIQNLGCTQPSRVPLSLLSAGGITNTIRTLYVYAFADRLSPQPTERRICPDLAHCIADLRRRARVRGGHMTIRLHTPPKNNLLSQSAIAVSIKSAEGVVVYHDNAFPS